MSVVLCNTLKTMQRHVSSIQCVCECVCRLQVPSHQRNDCDFVFFESADCFKSHLCDSLHPFKDLKISDLTRLYISAFFIYTGNSQ